jgi:hypothetical protein
MSLITVVFVVEAFFWLGAYIMIARRGFVDKTYGMPIAAMCTNIAWEFLFGLNIFPACPVLWTECPQTLLTVGSFGAAMLDVLIVITILKYGRQQFTLPVMVKYFPYIVLGGIFVAITSLYPVIASMYTVSVAPPPEFMAISLQGGGYTGFGMAVSMGLFFIAMFYSRNSLQGQTFYIALFMALGNVMAYLFNYLVFAGDVPIVITVFAFWAAVFNFTYVFLMYNKCRELGVNPWTRI